MFGMAESEHARQSISARGSAMMMDGIDARDMNRRKRGRRGGAAMLSTAE